MDKNEWLNLGNMLEHFINSSGTLYYEYDAKLKHLIDMYAPDNGYPFIKKRDYDARGQIELKQAIANWVKHQQKIEEWEVNTSAQLELGEWDEDAMQKIIPKLIEEKRLLVRGVAMDNDIYSFPDWQDKRFFQAKALFDVAVRAINIFQKTPTALVLFPQLTIPDSRVFGGFYGRPWSIFNIRTLRLMFRKINPHFDIHVCTIDEGDYYVFPTWRKVGVLFTYIGS